MHLVSFITKKFVTMHGHMNVKFLGFKLFIFTSRIVFDFTFSPDCVLRLHCVGETPKSSATIKTI